MNKCPQNDGVHTWILISNRHGNADSKYGCQLCPATARGKDLVKKSIDESISAGFRFISKKRKEDK